MEMYLIFISAFLALLTTFILKRSRKATKNLPPSPWKLPIIGHLHHLADGLPPHRSCRKLSQKHGELIYLQLGEIPTVLVSSSRLAKEILITQDLVFANRADLLFGRVIFYNNTDMLCSPYEKYYKQLRKMTTTELLGAKRVQTFGWIRQEEGLNLIRSIKASSSPVDLTHKLAEYNGSVITRAVLGTVGKEDRDVLTFVQLIKEAMSLADSVDMSDLFPSLKILHPFLSAKREMMRIHGDLDRILESVIDQHLARRSKDESSVLGNGCEDLIDVLLRLQESSDPQMPITKNTIKVVLLDMFAGGTDTAISTVEWAMAEMIRHPEVMAKAQAEIRMAFGENRTTIHETEIQQLKYLNLVVKETLRLHPPSPLLFPRESNRKTVIDGYTIPAKTRVLINVFAVARDSKQWRDNPDGFKPERFENSSVDFTGNHFEYLPFGAGKRMCPGMAFGLPNVYLPLALLLYHFDWELPNGLKPEQLDMTETSGMVPTRTANLLLLPKVCTSFLLARDD